MTTLNRLKKYQAGRIVSVNGSLTNRLMTMGLLPGTRVQVIRVAPLGDPILVQLDGCQLSLRRSEAEALTIEHEEPEPRQAGA